MSSALFASAPIVVLASDSALTNGDVSLPSDIGPAPVLAAPASAADRAAVAKEISRLGARSIFATDDGAKQAADTVVASLGSGDGASGDGPSDTHVTVVTDADDLPNITAPDATSGLAVLFSGSTDGKDVAAGRAAAKLTLTRSGADVTPMHGTDPRGDANVIKTLAADKPHSVIVIGPHAGSAKQLASRIKTAETGTQINGGGQLMFPGRTLVALYGHPGSSGLGVLGHQGLKASIARAKKVAQPYEKLVKGPVVPAFEIIATVATAGAGAGGTYSAPSRVSTLKPWVEAATKAGLYVILDLQPGRANLLSQAKQYESLLENPNVGLALDAEWKLQPGQTPLHQIGHVSAAEVNSVITWLGNLTAKHHLPQKLLVLHQFRISMLQNESQINTTNDDVSVLIHMDGQGAPSTKNATWRAVVNAAPKNVHFGWKDFYEKDHPMMTPTETMDRTPKPVMISYQ